MYFLDKQLLEDSICRMFMTQHLNQDVWAGKKTGLRDEIYEMPLSGKSLMAKMVPDKFSWRAL